MFERRKGGAAVNFEEIDRRPTPMGEISLRRRLEPSLQVDVYEVKLGDEFLMSSLFTVAETALATLGLAGVPGTDLDVLVGGLGLGYTARAVLQDLRVRSLQVVETSGEVIEWFEKDLVPLATPLTADPRCHLVKADFFGVVAGDSDLGPHAPERWHAVLVDIDHTPRRLLHPSHSDFYTHDGMERLARRLQPGGVFALWSDEAPDDGFISLVEDVFASCQAHVVPFPNFYTGTESSNTVYVARARAESAAT